MRRTRAVTSLAIAVAAATALLLSACGGGSGSSAATTAAGGTTSPAQTLQGRFVAGVKAVSPSVVEVQTPVGLGSGVVFDGKGDVVTNNHVVGSYKRFQVIDSTGRRYSATLVGTFVPDDLAGHVVGIPTLAAVDPENSQLASGIGFAIPSKTVKAIADQLVRYGHVVNSGRAYLGVQLATALSGRVGVVSVIAKGPAASAGIVAGDTITAIDGHAVQSVDDVATTLASLHPGSTAKVRIRTSAGKAETLPVTLGQYPGA